MSKKDVLMSVLSGERADKPPFTIYEWLIPDEHQNSEWVNLSLTRISACSAFNTHFNNIEVINEDINENGNRKTIRQYITPKGKLCQKNGYDPTHNSPWVEEFPVKTIEDIEIISHIYENISISSNYEEMAASIQRMGDKGIVLAAVSPIPLVVMWVELMGPVLWSEMLLTETQMFKKLHDIIKKGYLKQVELAAASPVDVIWLPDNVTGTMISPDVYREFCMPVYEETCGILKASGKLSFAHYDGDNQPLKRLISETGINIIEAFTPPPMGRMSVLDARNAWTDKVLSINFPQNLYGEKEEVIRKYARQYLDEGGSAPFIVGCTEDFEIKHFEHTFKTIADVIDTI